MNTYFFNQKRQRLLALLAVSALILSLAAACSRTGESAPSAWAATAEPATEAENRTGTAERGDSASGAVSIDLTAPEIPADGVEYADGVFTVVTPGAYRLSGQTEDKVRVDADGAVALILDGVTLVGQSCLDIRSNDPVTITSAAGSVNTLADAVPAASAEASDETSADPSGEASAGDEAEAEETVADEADAPEEETGSSDASGAVVTSKAPVTFTGEGTIVVTAAINNGVRCKDDLTVESGTLSVRAANDGLKARGTLSITGGQVEITADGDGLEAEAGRLTTGDIVLTGGSVVIRAEGRGIDAAGAAGIDSGEMIIASGDDGIRADSISVTGGILTLDSQGDGLQAGTDLSVTGGALSVTTGGGGGQAIQHAGESFGPWRHSSAVEETASTKGLKSDGGITIGGGDITLNTADDSVHCATLFTMDGGTVTICSNDDAIHSDDMLVINDGIVRIDDCFEGLEAFAVEVRGGDVVIRAVNDGMNANGSEMMFFRSSQQETTEVTSLSGSSTTYVLLAGGRVDLVVTGNTQNQGDGIDSNGAVYITGGEIVVSTFGTFMENGLDTGWGGPVVTGGMVIAGGSSTMAEGFSSYSTQCAAVVATSYMPDGAEVVLSDAEGNVLWDVVLADAFSCIQISHPAMQVGQVYTLTYGTESTTLDFTNSNLVENTWGFGFRGGFR